MVFDALTEAGSSLDRRIVDATLALIGRYGLAKLTLDDVAREAGCSRATLYRYHAGKQAVLAAVVESETARLWAGLGDALADAMTVEEALEAAASFGAREFAGHGALQFLLVHEPGSVLPHLCFGGADRLLGVLAAIVEPQLGRFLPSVKARRAGEWLARIILSYGCTPPAGLPASGDTADTEAAVLRIVSDFVVPAVHAPRVSDVPDDTEEPHA